MADIDPELRDKIVKTHTMMEVLVEAHKEQKNITNARIRDMKSEFQAHVEETKEVHKTHAALIDEGKTFRTRVIAYASFAATLGAFLIEPLIHFLKKFTGFA